MTAPTADPSDTLADVRQTLPRESCPGPVLGADCFWRYSLIFDTPANRFEK